MGRVLYVALGALAAVSLTVALLAAVLWVWSYAAPRGPLDYYAGTGTQVVFDRGGLSVMHLSSVPVVPHPGGGASGMNGRGVYNNFALDVSHVAIWPDRQRTLKGYVIRVRLWALLVCAAGLGGVLAIPLVARWRRLGNRREQGLCPACGYDIRATPTQCPECGRATDRATVG